MKNPADWNLAAVIVGAFLAACYYAWVAERSGR